MEVTVYSQENCMPCEATKRKLAQLAIPYHEIKITPEITEELVGEGWMSTPVVKCEDISFSGYRPDRFKELAETLNS